ncbi:MAG: MFS transporter [Elusimicrobiaceae bacterium]|jgi:MFS family permease
MMKLSWGALGRDFWLFRFGQVISVIGESCGSVALAWWILDATGSAAKMASVIAPTMFVKIFLLPLFGPFGDKFPRKRIIIIADLWRGVLTVAIAAMVFFKFFNLPLVITLYILHAIGGALFGSIASSIVPQLVTREQLPAAMRQEQAIMAGGSAVGGLAGGLLVTIFGIYGAFMLNAAAFLAAGYASLQIGANTRPPQTHEGHPLNIKNWFEDMKYGFKIVAKIPVELWLGIVGAVLNLVAAPLIVALPVLVKQVRNLPPWFLGALESSASVGSILGALSVGWLCKKIFPDTSAVLGVIIVGIGIAALPWVPNPAMPVCMMFFFGAGVMIMNIPVSTQMTLAMPDEYRARTGSVTGFMYQMAAPLGIAGAGVLIPGIGLNWTLLICGGALVVLGPALLLIPRFSELMRLSPEKTGSFYTENFPHAFKK